MAPVINPTGGIGSHFPVLAAAVARTTGPVLECGMGYWSTPMLHLMCRSRILISYEPNHEWAVKFDKYNVGHHKIVPCQYMPMVPSIRWSVAFIDNVPGESRVGIIKSLKDRAHFIVAHDTEADIPPAAGNYGWKELDGYFRYQTIYKEVTPWTTVYSDDEEFLL